MPIILADPFTVTLNTQVQANSKTVLVESPDHILVHPDTFAASTTVSPIELQTNPCKRQLDTGAWVILSKFIPLGEGHLMKGSQLVAVVKV